MTQEMKKHIFNLINSIVLIVLGLWGYWGSPSPSLTALIPVVIGLALLLLHPGVRAEKKIPAHVAVVFTILVLGGLVKPLLGAIGRDDAAAIARVVAMMVTSVLALAGFVCSFIEARRGRR
jgi:hypothetical protein